MLSVIPASKLDDVSQCYTQLQKSLSELVAVLKQNKDDIKIKYFAKVAFRGEGIRTNTHFFAEDLTKSYSVVEHLLADISELEYREGQYNTESLRSPGLVEIPAHLISTIQQVNNAKMVFKNTVKKIPSRQRRHLRKILPFTHMLQCYRPLVVIDEKKLTFTPEDINFYWGKGWASDKKTIGAVIKQLDKESKEQSDNPGFQEAIQIEKVLLEGYPSSEVIALRKPVQPYLAANLLRKGEKPVKLDAYLPLFYTPKALSPNLDINKLPPDWCSPKTEKKRADTKVEDEPLVQRLSLHRYLPEYREHNYDT